MRKSYQPAYVPSSERELRDRERGVRIKDAWSKPALGPCPIKRGPPKNDTTAPSEN